jgi:hypothetical protein
VSEVDSARDRIPLARLNVTKPNIARVYDYLVGGKDNFAADREFARAIMRYAANLREYEDFCNTHRPHRTLNQAALEP